MDRCFSTLEIKSVDEGKRTFTGIASAPVTDRHGDVVVSSGAEFSLPLPLLWQHNAQDPLGWVKSAKVTKAGIEVECEIATVAEAGPLKDRLATAWQMIREKIVRGLSIDFVPLESEPIRETGGMRFLRWNWLELSAVTIASCEPATITAIKSIAHQQLAGRAPQILHIPKSTSQKSERTSRMPVQLIRNEPKGTTFTRTLIASVLSKNDYQLGSNIAAARWGAADPATLQLKAAIGSGSLNDLANFRPETDEFFGQVLQQSIIGKLSGLRYVPHRCRVFTLTQATQSQWTGQGQAFPGTKAVYARNALGPLKVGSICVFTDETLRDANPEGEALVRLDMIRSAVEQIDAAFVDPENSGISDVMPAAVTYGAPSVDSTGDPAADLAALIAIFDGDLTAAFLVMSALDATRMALLQDSSGTFRFPDLGPRGGSVLGIPVVTSRSSPRTSDGGSIALIDPTGISVLRGRMEISTSTNGAIEMTDSPTGDTIVPTAAASLVSLFHVDAVAIKQVSEMNWRVARAGSVAVLKAVNY